LKELLPKTAFCHRSSFSFCQEKQVLESEVFSLRQATEEEKLRGTGTFKPIS
jgi:hypothetical protein